ncbi:NUDIX domain-containing protein [Gulosibacter sediminis]|uniref:NUDIX domain-containing protein n=1 Tax=Gulosibacter sediminis TaxID=1729695 RepID=UPI00186962B8|nr:NUDIX domain-containing protein [Gulosibacter sediminis]
MTTPASPETTERLAATVLLLRDGDEGIEVLMLQRPSRGSFASAWVYPGGKVDPEDGDPADEEAAARVAAAREVQEETELVVDPASLTPLAIFSPPHDVTPRFRTWFFVAPAFSGTPVPAEAEAVALEWVRPQQMLDAHANDALTLIVPTWVMLDKLTKYADVAEALADLRSGGFEELPTRARDGGIICWPGDAIYDDPEALGEARHRVETATKPWRYLRG